jgi:PAS domain S-box-containing protein
LVIVLLILNSGLAALLVSGLAGQRKVQAGLVEEGNFRSLFNHIPQGVFVYDQGTQKMIDANPAASELLGYSHGALLGKALPDFIPLEEREAFIADLKTRDPKKDYHNDQVVLHSSGRRMNLEIHARGFELAGKACRLVMMTDVTQARSAQAELKASHERFQAMVENLADALVLMSPEGRVLWASSSVTRVTGYRPEERVGNHSNAILHPDDREQVWKVFARAIEDPSRAYHFESRLLHRDGHYIHTAATLQNFLANPAIGALVLNYRDVSAEKNTQAALKRSEALFKALLEASDEGTVLVDERGLILYSSPAVERILGYKAEERVGRESLSFVHPDDHDTVRLLRDRSKAHPGEVQRLEYRVRHKDGSWRLMDATVVDRSSETAVNARVVTYRDVTQKRAAELALRQSEEFHRALIQNARDAILIYRPNGKVTYENTAAQEITGFSQDELNQMGPFSRVHPEDLSRVMKELEISLKNPDHAGRVEYRSRAKDGSWRDLEARGHNLINNSAVGGILIHVRDNTRTKEAQRQLLRYERLAAIGQTASGLAHEIRNPLAIISTTVHLLKSQVSQGAAQADLEGILKQVERLKTLVNETLERSKVEAPELSQAPSSELMDRALEAAKIRFGQASSRFETYKDYAQPDPKILADLSQMERVLVNLILNAFQAMGSDGAITLRTKEEGGFLVLEVADNGPGIPAPELPKIFEPFFSTKDQGSGLGLWICKSIVEEHGGSLQVGNLKPRGAAFSLRLPLAPKDSA